MPAACVWLLELNNISANITFKWKALQFKYSCIKFANCYTYDIYVQYLLDPAVISHFSNKKRIFPFTTLDGTVYLT